MDGRVDARIKKGLRGQNGSEQASLLNTYRTSTTRQQHKRNLRMKKKGGRLLLLREERIV